MANEQDQVPRIMIVPATGAPRRHSSKAHTVFDDVVELAVGKILGFPGAHVGHAGIEFLAHLRHAAAIVGVATCAVVREMAACLDEKLRVSLHRIREITHAAGNRQAMHLSRETGFERARIVTCAQASRHEPRKADYSYDYWDGEQQQQSSQESFH